MIGAFAKTRACAVRQRMAAYVRTGSVHLVHRKLLRTTRTPCTAVLLRDRGMLQLHDDPEYSPDGEDASTARPLKTIFLAEVVRVSRSQKRETALEIETRRSVVVDDEGAAPRRRKSKTTVLDIESAADLYAWMDALDRAAPQLAAMRPTALRRLNHVSEDPSTGALTGLPPEWVLLLGRSRLTRAQVRDDPEALAALVGFYASEEGAAAAHEGVFGGAPATAIPRSETVFRRGTAANHERPRDTKEREHALADLAALATAGQRRERYVVEGVLGTGSSGVVYEARDARSGVRVAAKRVDIRAHPRPSLLVNEVQALRATRDRPGLVSLRDAMLDRDGEDAPRALWIVTDLVDGCALSAVAARYELAEDQVACLARGVLEGLASMHAAGYVHRDVKADNVFVARDGAVRLGDMGHAARAADVARAPVVGTVYWMAPEVVRQQSYDGRADVWALGVMLLELVDGRPPRIDDSPLKALYAIATAGAPELARPEKHSQEMRSFLSACLTVDATARPTAAVLLRHAFIARAAPPQDLADAVRALTEG